ncbi:RNA-binding S4 domain-containing protein [bacterium]|nr:RNA-binding S4 domain-containing protein [bacterium]
MVFTLTDNYIELIKLLKVCGIAATGGTAKIMVEQGMVSVDGIVETRKRRKIYSGSSITCGDLVIDVR